MWNIKNCQKNIMESDSFALKLFFNWFVEYKQFDEIKFDTQTTDRRKQFSIHDTFRGHFFYVVQFM